MPRNRPNIGDTNWGTTLNNHLNQISPNGGGINYGTTAQRPTLTNNDDGYTYFDTTTKQVIRWDGTTWEVIIVGLPSDDAITNLTNQINTLTNRINQLETTQTNTVTNEINTLTNRINQLETTQTNTVTNQINTLTNIVTRLQSHTHSVPNSYYYIDGVWEWGSSMTDGPIY